MSKFQIVKSVKNKEDLLQLAREIGSIYNQADDTDHDGVVTLTYNPRISKYAYTNQALFPHTDRSNMIDPPDTVLLWCEHKADHGGETLIFDAEEHLLPVIDDVNFQAIYASENSADYVYKSLFDTQKNIFRFRNDAHIWIRPPEYDKFKRVVEMIGLHSTAIELNVGDCVIINNKFVFHGRKSYIGENRVMHRVLVYAEGRDEA